MTAVALANAPHTEAPSRDTFAKPAHAPSIEAAIKNACGKVPPLWPLKHFVGVNPFLGFANLPFEDACAEFKRLFDTDILMPVTFYREALRTGQITEADIASALAVAPPKVAQAFTVEQLTAFARAPEEGRTRKARRSIAIVAEVLDELAAGDKQASRTQFMADEISKWCAAYFDEGQAAWKLPFRDLPPYQAWRATAVHDLNPETIGIAHFRQTVRALPDEPVAAIAEVCDKLAIPAHAVEDYLTRALFDIGGWAGYARYKVWQSELYGEHNDTLVQLLAIRLVWGYALFAERRDAAFKTAWAEAVRSATEAAEEANGTLDRALAARIILQRALEASYQRELLAMLNEKPAILPRQARKPFQAAFCIDVRSEVYRRALEKAAPGAETIGFAGFFGFPIEYVPIGQSHGGAQCPVLLTPAFTVCEVVGRKSEVQNEDILQLRQLRRKLAKSWKAFKLSAVSSFVYVEALGLSFLGKLASDSAGVSRPVPDPDYDGLDPSVAEKVGPSLAPRVVDGRTTGFNSEQRLAMATAVLKAMSMTRDFARLVLLAGHGSTTVNNPHASGLDCGACGGHTGKANARVAAAIMNDPDVRAGLKASGLHVPDDTWFVAGLHDTTTDEVHLYDTDAIPQSHAEDLKTLRRALTKASQAARLERAGALGIDARDGDANAKVITRSRDWAQVRPEWGLAGNAAFIAAPRHRTLGLDLKGRSFLHSYEWQQDEGFGVLELILTAPMVVASWINLQYYGSTVNNIRFGSGNKVLHNVVGQLGVLQGNAGDLQQGLPWQSVHDGTRFVHEPLRLSVIVEAPEPEVVRVLQKHEGVRHLVENRWLFLYLIGEDGKVRPFSMPA
jgi:uncharacterized protein YbcC (UPF0753/DUF2309 family)